MALKKILISCIRSVVPGPWSLVLFLLLVHGPRSTVHGQSSSPPQCLMPRPLPVLLCEAGGEFLCVNTPPGSVAQDFVQIKGRLNLETSTLGTFSVTTQHEYTNEIQTVELAEPLEENCWGRELDAQNNFCLEDDGKFSVYVSLFELGPYTISVAAARAQGPSQQKSVRTSFVTAPTLTADSVSYELGPTHLRVEIDLLKDCEPRETCDFIGSTTGGVQVTVQNQIEGENPAAVRCETNVTQGGAGLFSIGVPVQPGENQVSLKVCNTADCLEMPPHSFQVSGELAEIEILSAPGESGLRFKVPGLEEAECSDAVQVTWNLNPPQSVCAGAEGIFESRPRPKAGLNIAHVAASLGNQTLEETYAFTHGPVLTPFDESGAVLPEEERRLADALQISFSKDWLNGTLRERLQDYLESEAFEEGLKSWTEGVGRGVREEGEDPDAELKAEIHKKLGFCPAGEGVGDLRVKIMETPRIGTIALDPFRLENQKMKMGMKAEDVEIKFQLYKDADRDGRPDMDPLPLKMAFKEVEMVPELEVSSISGTPFFLKLTSPQTDCDYKRSGACYQMPALFTPGKFKGNANGAGAFVVCDRSQGVSAEMEEICHGLNVVDRQTGGVIQEKILDVLNKTYACDAVVALNRKAVRGTPFEYDHDLFRVAGKAGLEQVKIEEAGIGLDFFTVFGSEDVWTSWPENLRSEEVGVLVSSERSSLNIGSSRDGLLLDIGLPLLGQMFWGMESKIRIDEKFFAERGFDFETECVGDDPSPLCVIRPRAQEIFGPVITEYGYLQPENPVAIKIKPQPAFPLHLDVLAGGEKLGLELADWELELISGKQRLITGRLSLLLVVSLSELEMPPDDPDHFIITLKTVPEESQLWLVPKAGSNTTVIPGALLLTDLEDKLNLAIDNFAQEGKEIKLPIPRSLRPPLLPEITWGPEGFVLDWNTTQDRLQLYLEP